MDAAPTPPPDPARAAARAEVGLSPGMETERTYRDRFRAQAASDPEGFLRVAQASLSGSDPLEKKAGALLAAREAGGALVAPLFEKAFDPAATPDPAVRGVAVNLLLRDLRKPSSAAEAWEVLHTTVYAGGRASAEVRRQAAAAVMAAAPESKLEQLIAEAERDADPAFRREALRGLTTHASPRAMDLLHRTVDGMWWAPELQALPAGGDGDEILSP